MLAVALLIIALAGVSLRTARRELEAHATTDALTRAGHRRKLHADLERRVKTATAEEPVVMTMFDLNGFKNYNDSFGYLPGDALLLRLDSALAEAVARSADAPTWRSSTSSCTPARCARCRRRTRDRRSTCRCSSPNTRGRWRPSSHRA